MKQTILITTGIIILVAISIGWFFTHETTLAPTDGIPLPVRTEELTNVQIGKTSQGNTDVSITPLQIIEDSRCPLGVQCVWAGRIVLKVRLAEGNVGKEYNFTEGEKVITDFGEITMTKVVPVPVHNKPLKPEDYQMTFYIKR
jgi:hypothetical protein